jgi:HPt (histidine-containing phosphotransfer) domain-containing protein
MKGFLGVHNHGSGFDKDDKEETKMNTMPQPQGFLELSEEQDIQFLSSSSSILNEELLAQYQAMDEGVMDDPLLPKLIGIFQKHIPEHLERLEAALDKQDVKDVTYVIHKMLGMAHNAGALRLSDQLMILENAENETRMRMTREDVAQLRQEFEAAAAALREYLDDETL